MGIEEAGLPCGTATTTTTSKGILPIFAPDFEHC